MRLPHVAGHKIPKAHPFSHKPGTLESEMAHEAQSITATVTMMGVNLPMLVVWGCALYLVAFIGFGIGMAPIAAILAFIGTVCFICAAGGVVSILYWIGLSVFFPKEKNRVLAERAAQRTTAPHG